MHKEIAIKIKNVSKKYIIRHEKPTLAEQIFKVKDKQFWALRNVSLNVEKGEKVGLIGPNGSGKTTLLKTISGITSPTRGSVEVFGKTVSLIDLQAGFHADLTGLQNIYLNGLTLGMSRAEIDDKLSKIVNFADIGDFINAQLFTYSSGMSLRLGFSIAIYSNPDILVLDEGMAVGDEAFKQKSIDKIEELKKQKKTFIIVSHGMDLIENLCERTIWIEHGKIKRDGQTKKVLNEYVDFYN